MKDWGRLLTATITPFDESGVNYAELARIADHLVRNGSSGIVVAGTTGESPTLTHDEKLRAFDAVFKAVGGTAAVVAGTGTNNTDESIRLTREAEAIGVDGVMLVSPYYNKPSQEGLFQHFSTIAKNTKLPIVVYNIQGRTSVNIETSTIVRLAQVENIIAVKEASGSITQISDVCASVPKEFRVYSGDDALTLPLMSVGGYGVISVIGHVAGPQIRDMLDHFVAGQVDQAAEIHQKLLPLIKALFCTTNPVPVKEAMGLLGFNVGHFRLPLIPLTPDERERVRVALAGIGLL